MKLTLKSVLRVSLLTLGTAFLSACGGSGDSTTGAGGAETTDTTADATSSSPAASVIGPDLNGSNWVGFVKSERDGVTNLTAVITHEGNRVRIVTTATGVAQELVGTINRVGKVDVRDTFDNENWTSVYGNVSKNSINLGDYIANDQGRIVDQNILILKR